MTDMLIHREMTIEDIFQKFPQKSQRLAQEMTNAGLHCVGCSASTFETLEAGMYGHGFDDGQIDQLIDKLNAILQEEIDIESITLTDTAAQKFLKILEEENKEGFGLRLSEKAAGCNGFEYVLDFSEKPTEEDAVYHSNGVDVHINKKDEDRLKGCLIDYADGLQGAGFKITNPNVRSSCSCGTSHGY
ncbi:MAG: iron-sulfur cluster assembly accessory protein [Chlamydiota bacterium]|jgi:iron-sulfur cluster assembly accessory protein